jgi:hypothetical protein
MTILWRISHGGSSLVGHGGSFLVIDRVDMVDYVFGVRSHTDEVSSVYLRNDDIEKILEFHSRKCN